MDAPPTPDKNKHFEFNQFDKKIEKEIKGQTDIYTLQIGKYKNIDNLVIKIIPEKLKNLCFYLFNANMAELIVLSDIFKYFQTIDDIIIEFEKISFEVEERNDELFLIFFMFKISGDKKKIEFGLKKIIESSDNLIKYINLLSNKIKELNTTIFNSQSNEQIINFQISQLKQENITLKTNAFNLSNEKNNYIIRCNQLQELLQNENNKYTKLENNYNQLKNENMKLKEFIQNEKNRYNELESICNQQKNEYMKLKELIQKENKRNNELESICIQQKNENMKLKELIQKENKRNNELESICIQQKNEYMKLKELIQKENKRNNELDNKYMELKKKYELLKEESQIGFKADASNILSSPNKFKFITNYIKIKQPSFNFNEIKLLYRGSIQGDRTKTCHQFCDNKQDILIFIKTEKGNIFGGYSKIGFKTSNKATYLMDNDCFLFSVNYEKIFPCIENKSHISHISDVCGLCFTGSLCFFDNFMTSNDNCIYKTIQQFFNRLDEPFEMNGGKSNFRCKELEVYQLIQNKA